MAGKGLVVVRIGMLLCCGRVVGVEARSLSDQINLLFGDRGIVLTEVPTPPDPQAPAPNPTVPHDAHFTSASLATLGLLVKQLAPSAADFPAISTVPGFTYRYNPSLQVFERSSESLGPVYVERPQTLGRGKFDLGVAYLSIDFDELDGKDLDRLSFLGLRHNDCCPRGNVPSPDVPTFETDTADLFFEKFHLSSHVVSFFATYGVADRWDVNLLLPVVFTDLKIRARAVLNNESLTNTHFFDFETQSRVETRSIADDKTGVGDLLLRTKYQVWDDTRFDLAFGLTLRVPTGDEDDFQGLGDTTLMPFVALATEWGQLNLHASSGVEINFDDSDRSRIRYGGGGTLQIVEQVALFVDVIGSANVTTDRISVTVPQFVNAPGRSDASPSEVPGTRISDFQTFSRNLSTDIVDLSIGLKANLYRSVVGYAGVFVPLNNDGLRSDVIPAAGVEVSF
ncbi:MAG: transporter [Candidatus Binatia bacterium]|nr:transporter [Candidatus Binatia bacterium]